MKVLHAISSLAMAGGGPVVALRGLASAQVKLGLNVRILSTCPMSEPSIVHALEEVGAGVTLLPHGCDTLTQIMSWTKPIVNAVRAADIVHVHGLWQALPTAVAAAARHNRTPYVIRPCGMLDSWSMSQRRLLKSLHLFAITKPLIEHAAAIHATTRRERAELLRFQFSPNVEVVSNGVDDNAFDRMAKPLPADVLEQLETTEKIVLFLGRVHPKKGLDVLLPAMGRVQTPGALLAIFGPQEAAYQLEIESDAKRLGITDRVRFLNPLYGDLRFSAYATASVFVLPSKQENFGISVAEAMASGTPIIVSPEVALSDMITAAGCGLVAKRDPILLAQAIDQLLADDALRALMGERGRTAAEQHFRWASIARQWNRLYSSLCDPSRALVVQ